MEEASIDREIRDLHLKLSEADAGEMRLAAEALERCSKLPEEFENYGQVRKRISDSISRMESLKTSIHSALSDHHWEQRKCKGQSVVGSLLGLVGVLAAPVSGGASLALTLSSCATNGHGYFRQNTSNAELQTKLSQMTEECNNIVTNTQKLFSESEAVILRIAETLQRSAYISRKVSVIPLKDSNGHNVSKAFYQIAGNVLIPLTAVKDISSSVSVCTTLVETPIYAAFVHTTIEVVKDLPKNPFHLGPVFTITPLSIPVTSHTLSRAVKLSQNSAKLQLVSKSVTTETFRTSRMVGDSQITSTTTVFLGSKVKGTAKATVNVSKSISKLNLAVNAACLFVDLYSLCNHEDQKKSETAKELERAIDEFDKSLAKLDEFISRAKEEHGELKKFYT